MANLWATRWGKVLIVVGAGLIVGLLVFFWVSRAYSVFFWPLLLALVAMAVLWFGIDFAVTSLRRRREASFDAGLAAKEGIDDRRREWASWTAELKKQGIDRYELPFYLLVGEPQSGKSILLQNSDLHFPFGQTRLSGIGGTRGCDWWFTEEAIVLDLAGRLFTHEGGASDEAEWGAFLSLLSEYRPMCPANGILLVIPCDRLIQDTPEKAIAKANKIQSALLSLSNQVQARMPVYVVLTKADKVFGFAETVHRLEAQKRQEMFGWSRPAEKFEAPFDLEEARQGFDGMVERARLLRAQMLSTARIPDALSEIDRLYAFPEELAALYPTLAAYLGRIFAESTLIDRLYFRGVYLTSGLQSGAPIAKVCGELFRGTREADSRNLEALFTKQRAYFIKDLVRKRVFAERGLVRPTRGRVLRARRNAWIGYGVTAAVAVAAIASSIVYLAGEYSKIDGGTYAQTLDRVRDLDEDASTPEVLGALERVHQAIVLDRAAMEDVFRSSQSAFEDLYVTLFDRRLAPRLRASAERSLAGLPPPEDYPAFQKRLADVRFLLSEIDLGRDDDVTKLLEMVPEPEQVSTPERDAIGGDRSGKTSRLSQAIELRKEYGASPDPLPAHDRGRLSAVLEDVVQDTQTLWDGVLTLGERWQVVNDLGYMLACKGLLEQHVKLSDYSPSAGSIHALCEAFDSSRITLERSEPLLPDAEGEKHRRVLDEGRLDSQLDELIEDREQFLREARGSDAEVPKWARAEAVRGDVREMLSKMTPLPPGKGFILKTVDKLEKATGRDTRSYFAPPDDVARILGDESFMSVCRAEFLDLAKVDLDGLLEQVRLGKQLASGAGSRTARTVFAAKCVATASDYEKRFPHIEEVRAAFTGTNGHTSAIRPAVDHLVALRAALLATEDPPASWVGHLESLLRECEAKMLEGWRAEEGEATHERTDQMIAELQAYLVPLYAKDQAAGAATDADHEAWLAEVDEFLADRMREHESRARRYWGDLSAFEAAELSKLASDVESRIELSALQSAVQRAPKNTILFGQLKAKEEFKSLQHSIAAQASYEGYAKLPPGQRVSEKNMVLVALNELVRNFTRGDDASFKGPVLAATLASARSKELKVEDALDHYLAHLRSTFMARLTVEVRRRYGEALRELVVEYKPLFDELEEREGRSAADDRALVERAGGLFDKGGDLDRLREAYKQSAEPPLALWKDEALGAVDQKTHEFETFLVELRAFFRGKEDTSVEEATFEVELKPIHEEGTLWTESRYQHFWSAANPTAQLESRSLEEAMLVPVLKWHMRPPAQKALRLRWSRVATATPAPEDAQLEIRGSFAPLQLAWRGKKDADKGFYVVKVLCDQSELLAPMRVSFKDRVLPARVTLPN